MTMLVLRTGLLLLTVTLVACASLQDHGSSAAARQQLAPTGKVRVAISVGPTATTFRATLDPATNRPRGVAVDLAHALGRQLGAPVELVTYSNYPDLLNGKRSINHVLADGQGPCLKPEVYFFGSAMRQGSSAS